MSFSKNVEKDLAPIKAKRLTKLLVVVPPLPEPRPKAVTNQPRQTFVPSTAEETAPKVAKKEPVIKLKKNLAPLPEASAEPEAESDVAKPVRKRGPRLSLLYPDTAKITVIDESQRRVGTVAHNQFAIYKKAKTVGAAKLAEGFYWVQLHDNLKRGYITIQ